METHGRRLVASLLAEADTTTVFRYRHGRSFMKKADRPVMDFVLDFIASYGVLPTAKTLYEELQEELPEVDGPPSYYLDKLEAQYVRDCLKGEFQKAQDAFLSGDDSQTREVLESLASTAIRLRTLGFGDRVLDFVQSTEDFLLDMGKAKAQRDAGIGFGWPSLDMQTEGVKRGDLVSLIGSTGSGKSWMSLGMARHAWLAENCAVMFVSMEMKPENLRNRLMALHTGISVKAATKEGLVDTEKYKIQEVMSQAEGLPPFYIVDGRFTATVDDVLALVQQLNPSIVFIDGAYLMKHPRETDRYKRVAENADLIVQKICDLVPVVASWQFRRDTKSKKEIEDVDLDDVGYSWAIAEVSSLVIGAFPKQNAEGTSLRHIRLLKGREGEVGGFDINWDFANLDFKEVPFNSVSADV